MNAVAGNAPPEQDMTGMEGRGGEEVATVTLLREWRVQEVREGVRKERGKNKT